MALETCEEGHPEIVFERGHNQSSCPVCELIANFKQEAEEKDALIKELEDDVSNLEDQVSLLKEQAPIVDQIVLHRTHIE